MPVFMPWPPAGLCTWAASPARNTRPQRYAGTWAWWISNPVSQCDPVIRMLGERGELDAPLDGDTQPGEPFGEDALGLGLRRGDREREGTVHLAQVEPASARPAANICMPRVFTPEPMIAMAMPIRSNISRLRACTTMARDSVVGAVSLSMIRTARRGGPAHRR